MRLNERPKRLVVLGDSHSLWSFASVSPMKRLHVGPVTMYRASRDGIRSLLPATYRPRRSDALMLSFGEIDCRVHLAAVARRSGRDLAAEVNLLCDRFESAATVFAQRFPGRVFVASVIPPAHFGRGINGDSTPLEDYLPEQLFIRSLMNERLAAIPGVSFFDYRAAITAPDGSLSPELSDRRWHLDPTVAGHLVVDAINERPDLPSVGYVPAPANPKSLDRRRSIFKKFRKWSRPYRRSITARLGFRTMKRPGTPSRGAAEDRGHRRDSYTQPDRVPDSFPITLHLRDLLRGTGKPQRTFLLSIEAALSPAGCRSETGDFDEKDGNDYGRARCTRASARADAGECA